MAEECTPGRDLRGGCSTNATASEAVANAVRIAVRNSTKGQPDLLVERAVLQARQEADLLYNVVAANVAVLEMSSSEVASTSFCSDT